MKLKLRNMLLAVPCFGISIAIYAHYLRWIDAFPQRAYPGVMGADAVEEIARTLPGRCLNEGPAVAAALVGVAILFGYWRIAAAIGIPTLVGSCLFLARVINWQAPMTAPRRRWSFSRRPGRVKSSGPLVSAVECTHADDAFLN
jgi:hypothetical protein